MCKRQGTGHLMRDVGRRHPEIIEYVDALRGAGALVALMSGSGSTVFGVFAEPERAVSGMMAAAQACPEIGARGVVVWTAPRVERILFRQHPPNDPGFVPIDPQALARKAYVDIFKLAGEAS